MDPQMLRSTVHDQSPARPSAHFDTHTHTYARTHSVSRDSVFGIATTVRTGLSGVWIPAGSRDFYLLKNVQTGSVAHLASCSMDTCFFFGIRRPGRDTGHSPPCSIEVKHEWSCTSTPPMTSWCGRRQLCLMSRVHKFSKSLVDT